MPPRTLRDIRAACGIMEADLASRHNGTLALIVRRLPGWRGDWVVAPAATASTATARQPPLRYAFPDAAPLMARAAECCVHLAAAMDDDRRWAALCEALRR